MKIEKLFTINSILSEIGIRIRQYRIGLSMTQQDLSLKTGISIRTISNIESGKDTTLSNIIRILVELDLKRNLEVLIPDYENEYGISNEKKRFKKNDSKVEWKWGDEK